MWNTVFNEINLSDALYSYWNQNRNTDYVIGEVVLSKDGTRLAIAGSSPTSGPDFFYAFYQLEDGRTNWDYTFRPGNKLRDVVPGRSISFSSDGTKVVVGSSRCDSLNEYTSGLICAQIANAAGPLYDSLKSGDEYGNTWGKSVSLSESGTFMAVGSSEGTIYVYDSAYLLLSNDLLGARVGDPIIVGDVARDDNTFGEIVKLAGQSSSTAVLAVGGRGDKVAVYQKRPDDSNWSQVGTDISAMESGEIFDISSDGNVIAVAYRSSIVHVYHQKTDNDGSLQWVRRGQNIEMDSDKFLSLSISDNGNILAVGAHRGSQKNGTPGYVKVFEFVNDRWKEMSFTVEGRAEVAGDVDFGRSVSLSGDGFMLAVGAPAFDGVEASKGYAAVFEVGDPFPSTMPSARPIGEPSPSPSFTPTKSRSPTSNPTSKPTQAPTITLSHRPSISPKPSAQPSISVQPSSSPSSPPTRSTCLFNCDCKNGMNCDLSQCENNCNCREGNCNMQSCRFDCRCEGGNCDMRRCGSNCQCPKRGCDMSYCLYSGRCVSGGRRKMRTVNTIILGSVMVLMIDLVFVIA
jgi:hypothetical protein